jgi:hypothetical protein
VRVVVLLACVVAVALIVVGVASASSLACKGAFCVFLPVQRASGAVSAAPADLAPEPTAAPPAPAQPVPGPGPDGLVNGDFEAGATGWESGAPGDAPVIGDRLPEGIAPHGGRFAAWLGQGVGVSSLRQRFVVPAAQPFLAYWLWVESTEAGCEFDSATVEAQLDGGEPTVVTSIPLCLRAATVGWQQRALDLRAYTGEPVTLTFAVATDDSLASSLILDDFAFQTTSTVAHAEVVNGNFEAGAAGWEQFSLLGLPVIGSDYPEGITPRSGRILGWMGGASEDVSVIRQRITIPPAQPYLSYWYWVLSNNPVCGSDSLTAAVVLGPEVIILDDRLLCAATETGGWREQVLDLRAFAGREVALAFIGATGASRPGSLFLDDIQLRQEPPAALADAGATSVQPGRVEYIRNLYRAVVEQGTELGDTATKPGDTERADVKRESHDER